MYCSVFEFSTSYQMIIYASMFIEHLTDPL